MSFIFVILLFLSCTPLLFTSLFLFSLTQDIMARLATFLAFEHFVFVVKLLAMWIVPDIPGRMYGFSYMGVDYAILFRNRL